ncbi:ABC-three component system middle component 6 [Acinetobacter chinensis]|uniref:ABC-three component system middle component 6 n=1 Tax=Acinetobacter chinensis TaxID=2004650 RepID=UPI0029349F7E|nr:ABC-three component system middle component 6 [Acinetobacter chinensis]WOE40813.1 hypothetical protein QSG87_13095 [Acinetobacter chinensis]
MIILTESEADFSLYYIGGYILDLISDNNGLYVTEVFLRLREKISLEITFNRVMYALDWLYMIGLIDRKEDGKISKCI